MKLDPVLSLALGMHSSKGVYALLLGSGVSRAAGIPTGWELVLDLTRKVAALQGEDCTRDPAAWYRDKYEENPNYSKLLDQLAPSPEARQQLLKSYFEPSDEERESGLKQSTNAHRAVARLVAKGYVRIIITTNFDRLIERAIENEGITPVVVSTPDALAGCLPLVHQRCLVLKVHGDYLDTRIRNTPAELARYDRATNVFLDQIFDAYGLIVAGWSGEWDTALRGAIERCKTRRFGLFWTTIQDPTDTAKKLISHRDGTFLRVVGRTGFLNN